MTGDEASHILGCIVDGVRCRFDRRLTDAEFEANVQCLPRGWFAFHLQPGETVGNSARVRAIKAMPLIIRPFADGDAILLDPLEALRDALAQEEGDQSHVQDESQSTEIDDADCDHADPPGSG